MFTIAVSFWYFIHLIYGVSCQDDVVTESLLEDFVFPPVDNLEEGSACLHTSGKFGVCKIISECSTVSANITSQDICNVQARTAIVCCVEKFFRGTGIQFVGVPSPDINFECGIRPILNETQTDCDVEVDEMVLCSIGATIPIPHTWPWTALIGKFLNENTTEWSCAGSVINPNYILSAAHCLNGSPNLVRLGEHNFLKDFDSPHSDVMIKRSIIHPDYKGLPSYHDLVLFELEKTIAFSDYIQSICLPWDNLASNDMIGQQATLTGWGAMEFGGELSPVILEATVEIFDALHCDSRYSTLPQYSLNWPENIDNELYICAGNTTHSVDSCKGDSGGPLVYKDEDSLRYILAGVTSQGYGCGNTEYPGLYINIKNLNYLQWIKDTAFLSNTQ